MISFSGDIGDNRYGAERARCEMGVCVCVRGVVGGWGVLHGGMGVSRACVTKEKY